MPKVIKAGIPDNWISQGTVAELRGMCGIDSEGIAKILEAEHARLTAEAEKRTSGVTNA